jgi:hypothetical protein
MNLVTPLAPNVPCCYAAGELHISLEVTAPRDADYLQHTKAGMRAPDILCCSDTSRRATYLMISVHFLLALVTSPRDGSLRDDEFIPALSPHTEALEERELTNRT